MSVDKHAYLVHAAHNPRKSLSTHRMTSYSIPKFRCRFCSYVAFDIGICRKELPVHHDSSWYIEDRENVQLLSFEENFACKREKGRKKRKEDCCFAVCKPPLQILRNCMNKWIFIQFSVISCKVPLMQSFSGFCFSIKDTYSDSPEADDHEYDLLFSIWLSFEREKCKILRGLQKPKQPSFSEKVL